MGCTEPIAVAYAAAVARDTLGAMPERVALTVSGNIVKNVKSSVYMDVKRIYRESFPAVRLIGRRYSGEENFRVLREEWFRGGLFAPLEALPQLEGHDSGMFIFPAPGRIFTRLREQDIIT